MLAKSQVETKDATAEVALEVLEAEVGQEVAGNQGGRPVQGREKNRCGLFRAWLRFFYTRAKAKTISLLMGS